MNKIKYLCIYLNISNLNFNYNHMKKLLSLILLSFTLLQSCTQDELNVAPKDVVTPAGVNLENAAKQISEKFVLSGAKAILLKPVDTDPKTHLTTLFYANAKGGISPIIENFEVKQVEVTNSGIYVLTNYSNIAFFVKYDNSWTQLEGVGDFVGLMNGDVLFSDGSVLRTPSLKVEKTDMSVKSTSENLILVKSGDKYSVFNIETGEGQPVPFDNSRAYYQIVSLLNDNVVVLVKAGVIRTMSMKTGNLSSVSIDPTLSNPRYAVRVSNNDIIIYGEGELYSDEDGLEHFRIYVRADLNANGEVEAYPTGSPEEWDGVTTEEEFNNSYTADRLIWSKVLDVVTAYEVDGNYDVESNVIYYSGIKGGQPATGFYDPTTNTNVVVSKDTFSSIGLL